MSSMIPIFFAICFIATSVSSTASPPSLACFAACMAMPSVTLAFSVFCAIEALISSTEAPVSSPLAACSPAPWLKDWAVALTSSEAEDRAAALPRISLTTCASRLTISRRACIIWPTSSRDTYVMRTVMSPWARRLAPSAAARNGRVMPVVMKSAVPSETTRASAAIASTPANTLSNAPVAPS